MLNADRWEHKIGPVSMLMLSDEKVTNCDYLSSGHDIDFRDWTRNSLYCAKTEPVLLMLHKACENMKNCVSVS